MRELSDPRTLCVDLPRFFGLHLGFKGGGRGRLCEARDRAPPGGPRSRRRALLTQPAIAASLFRRAIHVRAHIVSAVEDRAMTPRCSPRAAQNILFGIVGKSAAHKRRAATERIALRGLPAVLPGTVKLHAPHAPRLHRRMIGVVAIGDELARLPP